MNIKSSEKKEKNEVELIVEVNAEEFDSAINEAFRKNRNQIAVPGFRKGKAPRKIIERMYGASIFHEDALENLVPQVMSFVFKESGLNLVGYPQVTDLDIKEGNAGVDITITAAEYPEVKLGDYKGLSAVKPVAEVPDSDIDSEIEGVRLRNARIEKADRPAESGDTTVIDFDGFVDGKPFEGGSGVEYELELGSNTFIPGFEEKMIGMIVGEERDLELVFPENYKESLAGKPVTFKVKLNDLKQKILPDLDDEFAKDVSEFDTLDEYRESIRDKFLKIKQAEADAEFENALMDKVLESLEADVPEVMVEEQLDNAMNNFARQVSSYGMDPSMYLQMTNTTPEEFRENMRKSSDKQVRIMLALDKIAELEGIEISEEEVEAEYKEAAERFGTEIEKLKESVTEENIIRDLKFKQAAEVVSKSAIAEAPAAEDESVNADKPAAKATATPKTAAKKPAAKKPAASKTKPEADSAAAEDVKTSEDVPPEPEKTAKPPAKKPAAKKPKPEVDKAEAAEGSQDNPEPAKKTTPRKPKTTQKGDES